MAWTAFLDSPALQPLLGLPQAVFCSLRLLFSSGAAGSPFARPASRTLSGTFARAASPRRARMLARSYRPDLLTGAGIWLVRSAPSTGIRMQHRHRVWQHRLNAAPRGDGASRECSRCCSAAASSRGAASALSAFASHPAAASVPISGCRSPSASSKHARISSL